MRNTIRPRPNFFWLGVVPTAVFLGLLSFLVGVHDRLNLFGPMVWCATPILLYFLFLANRAQWMLPGGREEWIEALRLLTYRSVILDLPQALRSRLSPSSFIPTPDDAPASFGVLRAGVLESHQVLATARGPSYHRVAGPGYVRLEKFEQIDQLVDLRLRRRRERVQALTADGISLETRLMVLFRPHPPRTIQNITREARRRGNDGAPPPMWLGEAELLDLRPGNRPYPFEEQAILRLSRFMRHGVDADQNWADCVTPFLTAELVSELANHTLDDVAPTQPPTHVDLPALKQTMLRQARDRFGQEGIRIQTVGVGQFALPDDVIEQRIRNWEAEWERRVELLETAGEADAMRVMWRTYAALPTEIVSRLTDSWRDADALDQELSRLFLSRTLETLAEIAVDGYVSILLPMQTHLLLNQMRNELERV